MIGKWKRIFATLLCVALFNGCGIGVSSSISEDYLESEPNVSEQESSSIEETAVRYWRERVNFGIAVKDGVMWLGNEKVYEAGVNCYDLFNQCFADGYKADKAKAALDMLSTYNVKVVRFNCGGYASSFIGDYYAHIDDYLRLLGEKAYSALHIGVGVMSSMGENPPAAVAERLQILKNTGLPGTMLFNKINTYTDEYCQVIKEFAE